MDAQLEHKLSNQKEKKLTSLLRSEKGKLFPMLQNQDETLHGFQLFDDIEVSLKCPYQMLGEGFGPTKMFLSDAQEGLQRALTNVIGKGCCAIQTHDFSPPSKAKARGI